MNAIIEKGDIIAIKINGVEKEVEVLSVKTNGDEIYRFDYLDRKEVSPMRKTEYPSVIIRLLRKGTIRKIDPLTVRPFDNPVIPPTKVIVVEEANVGVHPAALKPAEPILKRGQTDKELSDKQKGKK